MTTINISLPQKLKAKADKLIKAGHYASFSDLVRHSLRQTVSADQYDDWAEAAKTEEQLGKAVVLRDKNDIDDYLKNI
jgi:Arc/MetJ-type ribon-helix-helix transcriptional regulator